MAHVWQWQLGYWVKLHGIGVAISGGYSGGSAYKYNSPENNNKTLSEFNMEQQGDIIAHYFAAKHLYHERYISDLSLFENVLKEFLRNPKNANLLPK